MFARLWNASSLAERLQMATQIAALAPDFDTTYQKLKKGRTYLTNVPRGFMEWELENEQVGKPHLCLVFIPYNYTPNKKYLVKVFWHGLVSTKKPRGYIDKIIDREAATYQKRDYISVYPAGWNESMWWAESQLENLHHILVRLKQHYNIDENRVHLAGMSDGGTGAYYVANAQPTPWASFFPYLANIAGLNALSSRQMYASNFTNRPFLIMNGEKDEVFPPRIVLPFIELLRKAKVKMDFQMVKGAAHNMDWFPKMKSKVIRFVNKQVRNPLPNQLYWETETTQKHQRIHWLCIDELTDAVEEVQRIPDVNTILDIDRQLFDHQRMSGRVIAQKSGNEVHLMTQNVKSIRLLCSPEHFDFNKPVKVFANQQLIFDNKLEKSVDTLLQQHAIDLDRTMLYGAELSLQINI
ncbi:hypothetical protein BKI52_35965 [marine bacterium AO1-C]|nr:hypothetical protein BKI52_35965 [marine bacterium AO1-C]